VWTDAHRHVALVTIQERDYNLVAIPLRSVRPFIIDEVNLNEEQEVNDVELGTRVAVTKFLKGKVRSRPGARTDRSCLEPARRSTR
jgi:double-strand break repair protein MRE11